jgi:hypothetical protein
MLRVLLPAAFLSLAVPGMAQISPFGVCAHLGGGQEFADHERELQLMEEAGIHWARADFTWGYFERTKGQWQFDNYDTIVAAAKKHQVTLLPILCYNVDWAFPAHEHLDDWCNYVRTIVTRYQADLRYWEVWNEPNISFWKPKPDAAQYAELLKATYKTIKAIDPALQVVYGGTAGVPLDYMRQTFAAGAFGSFDVLAIHPYNYPTRPDEAANITERIPETWKLLEEYGGGKRMWITEFGWPTHVTPMMGDSGGFLTQIITYSAKQRFPGRTNFSVAVIDEAGLPGLSQVGALVRSSLGALPGFSARSVGLAELAKLDPASTQVLVMPTNESYPVDYYPAMLKFVRDGGLLVHLGGVPFYYASTLKDGKWESHGAGDNGRAPLHVGWKAWWTQEGVPEKAASAKLVVGPESGITLPEKLETTRWLTDTKLAGKDKFVPLVAAYNGKDFIGYPVALYLYDSELKGGFLSAIVDLNATGVPEDTEALYLPRAYMNTLALGVENVFWYEFRDGGNDATYNEHRFGIIRNALSPKPAYQAYQTMTKALGKGKFLEKRDLGEGINCFLFDNGTSKTAALWVARGTGSVDLSFTGPKVEAFDYLGNPVELGMLDGFVTLNLSEKVLYVTGIDDLVQLRN